MVGGAKDESWKRKSELLKIMDTKRPEIGDGFKEGPKLDVYFDAGSSVKTPDRYIIILTATWSTSCIVVVFPI